MPISGFSEASNLPSKFTSLNQTLSQLSETSRLISTKMGREVTQELIDLVAEVSALSQVVLTDYSKSQKLHEIMPLASKIKSVLRETRTLLEQSQNLSFKQKVHGLFTQSIPASVKKDVKDLVNSLDALNQNIEEAQTFGTIVQHFKKNSNFPEKLSIFFDKLIQTLFGFLIRKVTNHIFIDQSLNMLNDLGKNQRKLAEVKILEDDLERQIESLKLSLNDDLETPVKLMELQIELDKVKSEVGELTLVTNDLKDGFRLAKETRMNLHTIGGTNVKLNLEDENVTLVGTHISNADFRKTLKEAGAEAYTLTFSSMKENKELEIKGIAFSKKASADDKIDRALTALGAFSGGKGGAGWQKVFYGDITLLVTDEEADNLLALGVLDKKGVITDSQKWRIDYSQNPINTDEQKEAGTVLLTSGLGMVYEIQKREILAFLMRGMNVMAINFRGYGESSGHASGEGFKRDMEGAYQYLKKVHQVPDDKIVLKALCMSGGPAAHLAAQHPDVNLFLDQTYANFNDVIIQVVDEAIKQFGEKERLNKKDKKSLALWAAENMTSIIHTTIKLLAPAWSVEKEISKVRGHVGILLTELDKMMKLDRDVYRNYQAASRGKQAKSVSVYSMKGTHGDSWVTAQTLGVLPEYSSLDELVVLSEKIYKKGSISMTLKEDFDSVYNSLEFQSQAHALETEFGQPDDFLFLKNYLEGGQLDGFLINFLKKDIIPTYLKLRNEGNSGNHLSLFMDIVYENLSTRFPPCAFQAKAMNFFYNQFKRDFLIEAYHTVSTLVKDQNLTPDQFQKVVNDYVSQLPDLTQKDVKDFIYKTIRMPSALVDNLHLGKTRYEGRIQMDRFLEKAHLKGSLV